MTTSYPASDAHVPQRQSFVARSRTRDLLTTLRSVAGTSSSPRPQLEYDSRAPCRPCQSAAPRSQKLRTLLSWTKPGTTCLAEAVLHCRYLSQTRIAGLLIFGTASATKDAHSPGFGAFDEASGVMMPCRRKLMHFVSSLLAWPINVVPWHRMCLVAQQASSSFPPITSLD